MARPTMRHRDNVDGDWYVDERCIDCGTCREIAPDLFGLTRDQSVVIRQPETTDDVIDAWLGAQACPTQSIGTLSRQRRPGRLYPREIEPETGVFALGYCSEDSFGASAWFVRRDGENVLVDSPRFTAALVQPIAELGGIDHIVLTHRDDVADADRWASEFDSRVWIHADDARAAPYATDVFEGCDDAPVTSGMIAIPVPGHTKGSAVFLLDDRYLFTGDSLAWSHERRDLVAFRGACWYSWEVQKASLGRLVGRSRFEWVLPGHGAPTRGDPSTLDRQLRALVDRM